MATIDQKQVQDLFDVVQAKKAEISKAEKPVWQTNCSFGYDKASSARINLRTVNDVNDLVSILAFIVGKERDFTEAAKILGLETQFEWFGFSKDDWANDIKARASQIQLGNKKKQLEEYEVRLNRLVSKEVREQMELAEIMKGLTA
jgi:hypothetical protein